MKYVDFKKFTDENGACPIYLFEGEEVYFRERGEALLKGRFLQEPTLDYSAFEGVSLKGDKMQALIDAVNTFPFVSERRVVKVTEFYPTEKEYESYLKGLFENPPASSILLILNSSKGKAGTASLAKKPNVTLCGRYHLRQACVLLRFRYVEDCNGNGKAARLLCFYGGREVDGRNR